MPAAVAAVALSVPPETVTLPRVVAELAVSVPAVLVTAPKVVDDKVEVPAFVTAPKVPEAETLSVAPEATLADAREASVAEMVRAPADTEKR